MSKGLNKAEFWMLKSSKFKSVLVFGIHRIIRASQARIQFRFEWQNKTNCHFKIE